jgi:uncharacterized protein (TIGR04551 family)
VRGAALAALAAVVLGAPGARASGFTDYGTDLEAPDEVVAVDGYFRTRGELLHNLDLDRGPTPSGELLFPVPLSDPTGQTLSRADLRLRTDLAFFVPGGGIAVKARIDALDNVALGSAPEGTPAASSSQSPDEAFLRVRRVYGEVLTPFGLLSVGRMGSHWGLGMLTHGGDCFDCDSGDASDRIAFVTPLLGHLWAFAYDFSATGPFVPDRSESRVIDIDPSANVHTLTFAALRYHSDASRARRARADRATFDYGAYVSHRWQENDVPATYLATAQPVALDRRQVMARGFTATALDGWLRLSGPGYRVELEAAWLTAEVEQPSLIPGVLLKEPTTSSQLGAALESAFGDREGVFVGGLDLGYASGDASPGFGAFPEPGASAPRPGDLDGPQAAPPFDNEVNNFRFHPDYRVDRILFREIIGTVTDATYLKPHAEVRFMHNAAGSMFASLAAVVSFAVNAESTPGGERPLGVELDPTISYVSRFGFRAALEQATLLPLSGLDNPALGLAAQPAQLWRLRLTHAF